MGGPLPVNDQSVTAFGAAASLIHPATGFSVSRSFREAPQVADEIQAVLKEDLPVAAAAKRVWERLWDDDKRAQVGVARSRYGQFGGAIKSCMHNVLHV